MWNMNTKEFERENERTIIVAEGFAPIVALCGYGEVLRRIFRAETISGKIVVVLSEETPNLNVDKIALADELFILNPDGQYDDMQAEAFFAAQKLGKHIRVLKE